MKGSAGLEETGESEGVWEESVGEHGGECGEDLVVGSMRREMADERVEGLGGVEQRRWFDDHDLNLYS